MASEKKSYIYPKKIIDHNLLISGAEYLFSASDRQICTEEDELVKIEGKGHLLLDFGEELNGGIRILTHTATDGACRVKVRFGESAAEAKAEIGYKNNVQAHTMKEFSLDLLNYSDIPCGNTGFRFVYIEFSEDKEVCLKSIFAEDTRLSMPTLWTYQGKDGHIRDIFVAAKNTIDLCVQNGYMYDGIKRDRLVWIGDIYSEILALTTLYGDVDCIPNSLNFIKKRTPLPRWMNEIPAYSLWWIIAIEYYARVTNNEEHLYEQKDYLFGLIRQFDDAVGEDGEFLLEEKFVDLNLFKQPKEDDALRALALAACQKAKILYQRFDVETEILDRIEWKLKRKEIVCDDCKTVAALKFFANGTLSETEKQVLIANGNQGVSTFMSYFIFDAIAKLFGKEEMLCRLKSYFGGMLDIGANTFWENFDPAWVENSIKIDELPVEGKTDFHGDYGIACYTGYRMSLCHGWSSGIIKLIKEYAE